MYTRNHIPDDYEIFCQWWESWGWPPIPYEFIPQNSIVVCDDVPICAVFLYLTDTPIIWAENYISSKEHPQRAQALDLLIGSIPAAARELGAKAVMSAVSHKGLARRLNKGGFATMEGNLTNYLLAV